MGKFDAVVVGLLGPKLGQCVTLMVTWPEIFFGPATPHPRPDCRAKCVRAQKGLIPGEIPKQLKFGRCVALIGTKPKRNFGPAAPSPCPDCSGKHARGPFGPLTK